MAKIPRVATVDMETEKIEDRPNYPPKPVGASIKLPGKASRYLAWGHPTENNCTKAQARRELKIVYRDHLVLFHNCAFDLEVGHVHLDLPIPDCYHIHDTLFLAYLNDPREKSLGLKPLADDYLNMPPDEQLELKKWILTHIKEAKNSDWGAYIAKAPGKLVGKYAKGDTDRTFKLFQLLYPYIVEEGMYDAYMRELKLVSVIMKMENNGVPVAVNRLKKNARDWLKLRSDSEIQIKKRLGIKKIPIEFDGGVILGLDEFNIGSGKQLATAMDYADKVDHWVYTAPSKTYPNGQKSTKRQNLEKVCNDKKLVGLLSLHSVLDTYINTFALPWIETAEQTGGFVYPSFNQVRSTDEYGGKGGFGTRSGRLSSSNPNFQNVPRNPFDEEKLWTAQLPKLRDYITPHEGGVLIGRDYNQQELRILAHFENGALLQQYLKNPRMDVHEFVRQLIKKLIGVLYERKDVKTTDFGLIYGMGVYKLAESMGCSRDAAQELKNAVLAAMPGIKEINKDMRALAKKDDPFYTWGGRMYYCEEPVYKGDRKITFEYKMLNLLIQGSAADCTKEAMINVDENCNDFIMMIQVHDELLGSASKGKERQQMKKMREGMEAVKFDVPMLSDGKKSAQTWARMKKWGV